MSLKSWKRKNRNSHQASLGSSSVFFFFFSSSADTWRSMRKSTTSARMMKKRSRGIPKPLFQSVQFPALITTSNTLYQVGRDSTCFSCTLCLVLRSFVSLSRSLCGHKSRSCLYQVHGFSFYLHTFLFSVSLKFSLSL